MPYDLKDMSPDRQKLPHQALLGWKSTPQGAKIAFAPFKDGLSKHFGYDGLIKSLIQLPISEKTIGYAAGRPIGYMRGMASGKDLVVMDMVA